MISRRFIVVNSSPFNKSSLIDIIKYPLITDKATRLLENNQYSFIVNPSSDKIQIRSAIENLFNVKVIKINTCHIPKKKKRVGKFIGWKSHYKKAIVTLAEGNTINLFAEN
uniref:Large ribosomal subunit protein uL23c n=1 Tax=Acanthoceras zachariasii TaxID=451788 RepID=A0A2U9NTP5_9STRA|nr:ribosomal protein L23 [Acanthoceras zachariasii]AWT40520.1 ribosomal protein L23 [Acanthoceras zachariasii]